ncbi:MAG: YfhO family protein [Patescibacteria group bacterium]|nr:YfhO family protein [Patescibacteria group bacterium]
MNILKKNVFLLLVILIGFFGVKALFHSGFYTSHDGEHQVIRLYHFNQALKDGQVPPRWAGTADNGYGYPLFIFSYQSPWFIGIPLLKVGLSLTDAIKGVFIIGYLLSGIFMYLWLKEMLGLFPGLLGSVLYLWAPYRFSNIFVRASLGEATAFIFIPLVFWGIWKVREKRETTKGIILVSLGLAGVILSHLMVLIIFALPLFFWVLLQGKEAKNNKLFIGGIIAGSFLGIILSSYYLIPAIFEKQFTVATQILQSHFLDHFVTLKQLIYSKWGYGFDFPGTVNDEMSFQVGIAQWLAMILLAILSLITWFRQKKIDWLGFFAVGCFVFSIIMMISVSKPAWEQITKYSYFDFPWRFLSLAVFSGSLGAALVAKHLKERVWLVVIFFISLAFYTNKNHLRVNQYVYNHDEVYINNLQTTNQFDEYRAKTLNHEYVKVKRERVEFSKKEINLEKEISSSNYLFLEGEANQKSLIKLNIAYYPGWQVWLNQKEQTRVMSSEGVMEIPIPKDKLTLEAKFTETLIRKTSNLVSLIGLMILLTFIYKDIKLKNKR